MIRRLRWIRDAIAVGWKSAVAHYQMKKALHSMSEWGQRLQEGLDVEED